MSKLIIDLRDADSCALGREILNAHGLTVDTQAPVETPTVTPAHDVYESQAERLAPATEDATILAIASGEVPAQDDPRGGLELDANGTPWLEDVHATTKAKTKDGVWKKRRGTDDDVVQQAEAAARAKMAGTPEPAAAPEPEPVQMPEDLAPVTMDDLAAIYSQAVGENKVTPEEVTAMYARAGCDNVSEITTNETARALVGRWLTELLEAPTAPTLPGM